MLHLITGYRSHERSGDPEVLYCGFDAAKATQAFKNAPAHFLRIERAHVFDSFKQPQPIRPAALSPLPAAEPASAVAAATAEAPADEDQPKSRKSKPA